LGEIVTTHGIAGWLKLNPYNPDSPIFSSPCEIILEKGEARLTSELQSSRRHRHQIILKLGGIDTIDSAQLWVGATLAVKEEILGTLAPGEYYHYQVVGLQVFDTDGTRIGIVTQICSTPGSELYVVAGPDKEHLIPAVKEIIEKVDLAAGTITINPPPGLLDL
jgi:16S rRNA processing protein RimM